MTADDPEALWAWVDAQRQRRPRRLEAAALAAEFRDPRRSLRARVASCAAPSPTLRAAPM